MGCGTSKWGLDLINSVADTVRKSLANKTDVALASKGKTRSTPSMLGGASCEEACEIAANEDIACLAELSAHGVIDSQCFLDGLDNVTTNYEACIKACP